MKQLKFIVLAGLAAVLVSGCASSIDTASVAGMQTSRDAFKSALHKEYTSLAKAEQEEGDADDTKYFIKKAKDAGLGLDVLPQQLSERKIPNHAKGQLSKARMSLVNKLWNGGGELTPGPAARAQAMFDCWLQEQEEGDQSEHIRACRQAFQAALYDTKVREKTVKLTSKKKAPPAPMPAPFVVYFGLDSADITDGEMTKIKQAYADYRLRKPGKILVAGHADTSGNKKYNMRLSRYRAAEVSNRLMELGVPRKRLKWSRYGEIAPVVDSGDNKREGKNRRVTITFLR
ncbi:MAG: hypothetical protein CMF67_00905 [Magnetovibrio sp.]|nr:hypothetical protein [Magnetovibrio sp.]|tara:strand:+ start:1541 stop:2404 length:864 start_codon:yes stop_codon:yes gene_type:complete